MSDIHIGWDGSCKDHPSTPTIARPADPPGTMRVFSAQMNHAKCGRVLFGRVLQIHCARGHQYLAIDTDELIHDPFTEREDLEIITDESAKIIRGE